MKLYGYSCGAALEEPTELEQVTVSCGADELKEIAAFLIKCADEIDKFSEFDHEHMQWKDQNKQALSPEFIVHYARG